jgi:thioglycine synthase
MSNLPSIPPLCLKNMKKHRTIDGNITTRVKSLADTLAHITPVCNKIGVTRICDITYLDKLYVPNYCSVLPGTQDSIWVYSGKGPTRLHAKVSALMESIERYCSLSNNWTKNFISGTFSDLSKIHKVLHPDEVVEPVGRFYSDKTSIMDFVAGFDLLSKQQILVPAQLAFSRHISNPPSVNVFPYSHTNGLASGNVIEEAICHALCEVIERDAVSIAELSASSIPYSVLQKIINSVKNVKKTGSETDEISVPDFVDDPTIFQDVDILEFSNKFVALKHLVERFDSAGISLLIKDITQKDIGIPTFVASSVEWVSSNSGYFAYGYGTHLDSRIALIRAITELSQTRAVNIQGARDDCRKIDYKDNDEIYKRKWQFMPATSSLRADKKNTIAFSEIKSYIMDDVLDEVKFLLKRLKKSGIKKVIVVDLTDPRLKIPVVRVIVPGLETFEVGRLFRSTELIIGRRAKKFFRKSYDL